MDAYKPPEKKNCTEIQSYANTHWRQQRVYLEAFYPKVGQPVQQTQHYDSQDSQDGTLWGSETKWGLGFQLCSTTCECFQQWVPTQFESKSIDTPRVGK